MKIKNICIVVIVSVFLTSLANAASRTIHAEWNPMSIAGLAGFRLYQENNLACEVDDPSATSVDCEVSFVSGETWFTLTYFLDDGAESAHSAPLPYSFSETLAAHISANRVEGQSPLEVQFYADSSTGDITAYHWSFGDGSTATGSTTTHTFNSQGSYLVTLTVNNIDNETAEDTLTITVSTDTNTNAAPTAAITSSSAIGAAPFQIALDASGSSDSDGEIVSYQWDLGDGSLAEGMQVTHTYTVAGSYTPTLTVTDDGGLTDSTSTPVLVESSSTGSNAAPVAAITASATTGGSPLTVTFDAAESNDSDGSIVAYHWAFGDGQIGTGERISHTFEQPGEYTVELSVTDNYGAISQPATLQVTSSEDYQQRVDIIQIINLLLLNDER